MGNIDDIINTYQQESDNKQEETKINTNSIPNSPLNKGFNESTFEDIMSKETDPDLMITSEVIELPSKGMFYKDKINSVVVEYLTSKDEDIMTTPSLLEKGKMIDVLLKRKIKSPSINPADLLPGDRNAILLFLRTSSYGTEYKVNVIDPRTKTSFPYTVDLSKLKYKEMKKFPDEHGYFTVEIPMRKKVIQFRLLTSGEETLIFNKAESLKDAYGTEFSEFNTMKLKESIVSIDGKTDRSYITRFVDAMPALDAFTIRKEILDVSPDVDLNIEFVADDGYKFKTLLPINSDFFFPNI